MTGTIRSEERGFHWVAWIQDAATGKPLRAVLFVGVNRQEAETRASAWLDRQ